MEGDQYFPSQPFVVTADCLSLLGTVPGGPLERQELRSHVYRKTGTLPLKNQSRHYMNDEV